MAKKRKYTKEYLTPFVEKATSYASLMTLLGLRHTGGNHRLMNQRVKEYNLCIKHFTGQSWNKGFTKENNEIIRKQAIAATIPDSKVFCLNSGYPSSKLRKRLLALGWKEICAECDLTNWRGKSIRLHVDHKNGNHSDHRLKNLRFLCPNCHQQTDTWGTH